ncbi:phage baseplate assembly protein [Plastoroseomonas hellenica]|uniref:phage baseplate assembly protein n=1 Tax=Plastoroseomonas hellenica TaxID=2687306 RepID=UPI001BA819F7|nr:hypothetical protein [Plastoroseomonas hellenica]MBR0643983.1 Mu P family protein [Plastoroseomonas hellenica]
MSDLLQVLRPARPTRRVRLQIGGQAFEDWQSVEITRSLEEIAGSFELRLYDAARVARTLGRAPSSAGLQPVHAGQACTLQIDGTTVLIGWVDDVKVTRNGDSMSVTVAGRDKTGDLVDCAAAPEGPSEYRNITLTALASRLCQPFGITVRADTDVGAPIPVFTLDASETALSALEKAARQRAVLLVSDGIGGLVLTRGGASRGPAAIQAPSRGLVEITATFSWRERFRDYIVKGQTRGAGGQRMDGTAAPLTAAAMPAPPSQPRRQPVPERQGVVMTGRARDEEVTRYRPHVEASKTQSGGASVATMAQWRMRVARAKSEQLSCKMLDWRAGDGGALWRLNELVPVDDAVSGINGDMLISSVAYQYSEDGGETTQLELVGPEAYDLEPVAPRQRGRQRQRGSGSDGTARALTADPVRQPPAPPARR